MTKKFLSRPKEFPKTPVYDDADDEEASHAGMMPPSDDDS